MPGQSENADITESEKTAQEETKEAGKGFLARIDHPVFGAFSISWLICNWEIPYLLIRGLSNAAVTINEINNNYLAFWNFWHLIIIPIGTTFFYLFVGPYFKKWLSVHRAKVEASERFEKSKTRLEFPVKKYDYEIVKVKAMQLQEQVKNQQEAMSQINVSHQQQLQTERDKSEILKQALSYKDGRIGISGRNGVEMIPVDEFLRKYYSYEKQVGDLSKKNIELRAAILNRPDQPSKAPETE